MSLCRNHFWFATCSILQVVLIDFAMAVTENVEMATGHRGKPSYMAPEMFVQQSYDALAADVFSCGVCAYALAMGSYPWSSTRPNACLAFMFAQRFGLTELLQRRRLATSNRQRVPIASCMTPGFHQILAGMLKMDPAKRPKFHHLDWVQKYGDAFGWWNQEFRTPEHSGTKWCIYVK